MKARTLRKITNACVCIGAATTILISPYFHKEAVNLTYILEDFYLLLQKIIDMKPEIFI